MKFCIVFAFCCTISLLGISQNYILRMQNKGDNKELVIFEREKIKIITNKNVCYKGTVSIVNDSTLMLGHDSIYLKDVKMIKTTTAGRIIWASSTRVVAGAIMLFGASIFTAGVIGTADLYMTNASGDRGMGYIITVPMIIAGVATTPLGYIIYKVSADFYKTYSADKYFYKIEMQRPVLD